MPAEVSGAAECAHCGHRKNMHVMLPADPPKYQCVGGWTCGCARFVAPEEVS